MADWGHLLLELFFCTFIFKTIEILTLVGFTDKTIGRSVIISKLSYQYLKKHTVLKCETISNNGGKNCPPPAMIYHGNDM